MNELEEAAWKVIEAWKTKDYLKSHIEKLEKVLIYSAKEKKVWLKQLSKVLFQEVITMNDLCIGLIFVLLIFILGELLYKDYIPKDGRHPIQQETMTLYYEEE